ncbi:MAG TPA: hypothetical protein VGC09_12015 [Rhodopila sp.]
MTLPTARAAKRDLIGNILVIGLPMLGGRVFQARVWPMQLPELPAVLVYGWQETKTRRTLDAWTHQFEVECAMALEGMVQAPTGPEVEDGMEALAGDIEYAILTSPLLLGLTGSIERIDRVETKLQARADAEMVQGTVSMAFHLVWTEIHQVVVPRNEPTTDFGIKSTSTIFR